MRSARYALLSLALLGATTAHAVPSCPTDRHLTKLQAFEDRLRGADSVEEARELALDKVDGSRDAVERAAKIVPNDPGLEEHIAQLDAFAEGVAEARTTDEVAHRFSTLRSQRVAGACAYTTGEIIAIVLGLVLGIIPGIILLILLC